MLDRIHGARAAGDDAVATQLCAAVVHDFEQVVDTWESTTDIPFDEHHIALEHLLAVLDQLASLRGSLLAASATSLRARCAALLARSAAEQARPV